MQISLYLPDKSPFIQLSPIYLKQMLTVALYYNGKLSSQQACSVLELSRREFEELVAELGFSMLLDDDDTIETELMQ